MTTHRLWCLWDATEPVSLHRHRAEAEAARRDLLDRHLDDFPADHDELAAALFVEAVHLSRATQNATR